MARTTRVLCISIPYVATIIALILMAVVILGGRSNSVFAWQADFTDFKVSDKNNQLQTALEQAQKSGLDKLYQIYVFNYCHGDTTTVTCTDRWTGFSFNFVDEWHLSNTTGVSKSVSELAGNDISYWLSDYQSQAKLMGLAFQFALWFNVITAVAGILALFSRIGSFITWIFSALTSILGFTAAINASIIFGAIVGALDTALQGTGARINLGSTFMTYLWSSVTINLLTTTFYLFSIFCCGGEHNPHHRNKTGGLWHSQPKYGPRRSYKRTASVDEIVLHPYPASLSSDHAHGRYEDRLPAHPFPKSVSRDANHVQEKYEAYRSF